MVLYKSVPLSTTYQSSSQTQTPRSAKAPPSSKYLIRLRPLSSFKTPTLQKNQIPLHISMKNNTFNPYPKNG
jgi:hypothetical protein